MPALPFESAAETIAALAVPAAGERVLRLERLEELARRAEQDPAALRRAAEEAPELWREPLLEEAYLGALLASPESPVRLRLIRLLPRLRSLVATPERSKESGRGRGAHG